jgi:DeoR/GlpR family transcriptional regulator of sugar metabolism
MLGVNSLHPEVGISDLNIEETYVKRMMIENAAEVAALVSAEKFGTAAPYLVCPVRALTYLVTERTVPDELIAPYRDQGLMVLRA